MHSNDSNPYDSDLDPEFQDPGSAPNLSDSDESENSILVNEPVATSTPAPNTVDKPSAEAKTTSRKRLRKPETWKKVKQSKLYNSGYIKKNGESTERVVGGRCQCKRKKCSTISDENRAVIFQTFWGNNSSPDERYAFIAAHTEKLKKVRGVLDPIYKRGENVKYFLTIAQHKISVCEKFFLSTLSISKKMVHYNLSKMIHGRRQKKTKRTAANKTSEAVHTRVKNHISSFPKIESHYCRSDTKREYLESSLNIRRMYRMFIENPEAELCPSETFYRKVFNEEFNLGFHVPSKDQCDTCDKYQKHRINGTLTPAIEEQQVSHLRRKSTARAEKDIDKSKRDGTLAVCFDLQQVLTVPRLFTAKSYYKRKINMYNLTFYELQTGLGHCYTWTEAEANRGANDIATCVVKFLKLVDEGGKYDKVILYSDTCGGQNRNRHLITAILSFLYTSKNIIKVEQKFFESGHSHMECDSMHSCIEEAFASKEIDLPSDYIMCMRTAKKSTSKPYSVTEITSEDITDFAELNSQLMNPNAFSGIMKVHHLIYCKSAQDPQVSMSEEIGGEKVDISYRKRGGRYSFTNQKPCYQEKPGVSSEKKADVLALVDHMTNKTMARLYYNSLPVSY